MQLIAALFTGLVVCSMVGGVTISVIVDVLRSGSDSNTLESPGATGNDEILREMQTAVAENPQSAEAEAALGNYYANTDDFDLAVRHYERAVQLAPEDWTIRLTFAQALMANRKLADAELQFDRILAAQPQNAAAWYYLGQLYQLYDPPRDDEAIFAFQQVIRFGPDTYVATEAANRLSALGATPIASPAATPGVTP